MTIQATTPAATERLGVFISYARLEAAFVKRLIDHLEQDARVDIWQDTEDLLVGEDWNDAIQRGIEKSDVFVFVYSLNALASKVCNEELAYALKLNKHIVAFRYETVRKVDLPLVRERRPDWTGDKAIIDANYKALDALQGLRYFDDLELLLGDTRKHDPDLRVALRRAACVIDTVCEPQDEHRAALETLAELGLSRQRLAEDIAQKRAEMFGKLTAAIFTDPAHVRAHTRYLQAVRDWERNGQRANDVLSVADTNAAEQWLINIGSKEPQATDAMKDYIARSRTRHNNNLRRTIGGVVSALIIALMLSVFLYFANQRAERNEQLAVQEADRANREADNALAALDETQNTLRTFAIDRSTLRVPVSGRVTTPIYHDGALWMVDRDNETLLQLSAVDGEPLGPPIAVGALPLPPQTDGRYVWVANGGADTVTRVDPQTGDALTLTVGPYPSALFAHPDATWVVTGDGLTQLVGDTVGMSVPIDSRSFLVGATDDAHLWVVDSRGNQLLRVNRTSGTVEPFALPDTPREIVYADGRVWVTYQGSGQLDVLDAVSDDAIATVLTESTPIEALTVGAGAVWLSTEDGDVLQVALSDNTLTRHVVDARASQLFVSDDVLWFFALDDRVISWPVDSPNTRREFLLPIGRTQPVSDSVNLWLVDTAADAVFMASIADGQLERSLLPSCDGPQPPYFDGANVWFPCHESATLNRVPALLSYYTAGDYEADTLPKQPITADGYVWILQESNERIVQLDAATGQPMGDVPIGSVVGNTNTVAKLSVELTLEAEYDGQYLWAVSSGQVTRIHPDDLLAYDVVPLTGIPTGFTLIGDYIWVTSAEFGTVERSITLIHRETLAASTPFDITGAAMPPVYDELHDVVWLTASDFQQGKLYRIDPNTLTITGSVDIGFMSYEPFVYGDSVWVVSVMDGDYEQFITGMLQTLEIRGGLYRVNRADATLTQYIELDEMPGRPFVSDRYLWVSQFDLGITNAGATPGLIALDIHTGQQVWAWESCSSVNLPYFDGRYMWASCFLDDDPSDTFIIDEATLEPVAVYPELGDGSWPAVRIGDEMWIAHQQSAKLSVFDMDGALLREYGTGAGPTQPVWDGRYIWVSNANEGTVQRILHPITNATER